MLFSKNKIKESIKNADVDNKPIDSEFESLASIKRKQKDKKLLNKLIVNPYRDGVKNLKLKKETTKSYIKSNYKFLILLLFIATFLTFFISLAYTAFLPFEFKFIGNTQTSLSNFYFATNNSITGITTIAIVIIVFFIVSLILGFLVFKWYKSRTLINTNKVTKILSICCYITTALVIVAMLLIVLIPPDIFSQDSYQSVWNYIVKIDNATIDAEKLQYIKSLNDLIIGQNLPMSPISTSGNPTLQNYFDWRVNSGFILPGVLSDSSLLYASDFSLTTTGIVVIVLVSFFGFSAMIICPLVLLFYSWIKEIRFDLLNKEISKNYNFIKSIIYNIMLKFNDFSIRKMKDIKEKETYHKYKKRLDKTGSKSKNDELFTTNVDKEQLVFNQENKLRDEFLKNEPNVAFLSSSGKWMYHDGNNNFFIARGDEWVPFDISKEIHKAHANIVDENLNFSPSEKKIKESKINLGRKKENDITIPDQEIDDIVKSLNI